MLGRPIAHDEALEAHLVLEDTVEELGVLATIRVVDLIVRAHDGTDASADGISKGPGVELVHSLVVQVGGERLGDVVLAGLDLATLSEVFYKEVSSL